METNQVNTLLPAAAVAQMPPDVRAKLAAAMQAQERASAPSAPYTSKTAGLLKAMQGGLGGILQNATLQNEMQAQAAHRETLAKLLLSASPGAMGTAGGSSTPSASTSGAAPAGQGGAGSDHVVGQGAGDYLGRLGQIESGNRDGISNKASGATGRYQFIASTWDRLSKQYPELGLTPDGRTDPAQQQRAIQAFTNDNASALGRSGFQATPGNLYLAHFAGAGGATAALKADPNTPVEQVLGGAAVRANPFLKGKTAGDLVQWANGKMAGVDPSSAPGAPPAPATAVASNTTAPSSTAPASVPGGSRAAIGDGAALAAENRLKTGAGTDADRALLASYRQQQNTPAPSSDGTVRGDLLAAAAQYGMHPSAGDMPAADAHPVSMASLPPGVSPEMFAATPGAVTASGVPHQLAPGAKARADSGVGAGIGGDPGSMKGAPSGADAPFDPEGTGPQNYDLSAAPDLRTALVAAMNGQGPTLGTVQPAVVPDPVPASTPDAPPAPSLLPPAQPPSGLGTAGAPVVPAPQGTLAPPPAPAPDSDGSVRGDLIAAAQKHGLDVAMDPVVPDPAGTLVPPAPSSPNAGLAGPQSDAAMGNAAPDSDVSAPVTAALPDAGPMPPQGGQTPQVMADQAAAASPTLDPEGTGPQNYGADGPTLRDMLTAAMNGGGSGAPQAANPPPSPAATGPGPAPAPTQTAAAMPLPSADDPVGGLVGAPGSPTVPPAPMAGSGAPSVPPGPDKAALLQAMSDYRPASGNADPGSGATLPTSGPMTSDLADVLNRPSTRSALAAAERKAQDQGRTIFAPRARQFEDDPMSSGAMPEPPIDLDNIPPFQAEQAASRPGPVGVPRPPDLHDFIRSAGGVRDPGGDLAAMGYDNLIAPPGKGLSPDQMRQAAAQAGYLGPNINHATASTGVNDLFGAIASDNPIHSVFDQDAAAQWAARDAAMAEFNRGGVPRGEVGQAAGPRPMAPGLPFSGPDAPTGPAARAPQITPEGLDYVKRALQDKADTARRTGLNDDARIFGSLKDDLLRAIENHPDPSIADAYGAARRAYAGPSREIDALNAGRASFADNVTPEQVQREYAALGTDGERQQYRNGMFSAGRDKMAKAGDTRNFVDMVAGNDAIRAKFGAVAPHQGAVDHFNAAMDRARQTFTEAQRPTPQTWHGALDSLDGQAAKGDAGAVAARDALEAHLGQNPDFARARGIQKDYAGLQGAVDYGRESLGAGSDPIWPSAHADRLAAMTPAERAASQIGQRSIMEEAVGTKPNDQLAMKGLFQIGNTPGYTAPGVTPGNPDLSGWNAQKIAASFGHEPVARMQELLNANDAMNATYNTVTQNSVTARRNAMVEALKDQEWEPRDLMKEGHGDDTALGLIRSMTAKGVNAVAHAFQNAPSNLARDADLARIGTLTGPERDAVMGQMFDRLPAYQGREASVEAARTRAQMLAAAMSGAGGVGALDPAKKAQMLAAILSGRSPDQRQ